MKDKFGPKLEVDSYYHENDILKMEMKPLDNKGMQYELYSKGFFVYYFRRIEGNVLQLFCCTSKEAYYFSDNSKINAQQDQVGLMTWLFA